VFDGHVVDADLEELVVQRVPVGRQHVAPALQQSLFPPHLAEGEVVHDVGDIDGVRVERHVVRLGREHEAAGHSVDADTARDLAALDRAASNLGRHVAHALRVDAVEVVIVDGHRQAEHVAVHMHFLGEVGLRVQPAVEQVQELQ
jgi:hypothetical protein